MLEADLEILYGEQMREENSRNRRRIIESAEKNDNSVNNVVKKNNFTSQNNQKNQNNHNSQNGQSGQNYNSTFQNKLNSTAKDMRTGKYDRIDGIRKVQVPSNTPGAGPNWENQNSIIITLQVFLPLENFFSVLFLFVLSLSFRC